MDKSPVTTIETKVERNLRKNWKRIILLSSIILIFIFIIFFIMGIRIRLALYDNLIIRLSPSDRPFTIPNDQNQSITFHVSIEDSTFCVANCSYAFYDRSEEEILERGSLIMKNEDYFNRTYQLLPYRKGSGQKIYNFDVQCSNIRSFICATKGQIRQKSSFITLNYKLTEKEERIKSGLKPIITESFLLINNASRNLQKSFKILNTTAGIIEYEGLYNNYSTILGNLNSSVEQSREIARLWSQENYITLNVLYEKSLINESGILYKKSGILLNDVVNSVKKQNYLAVDYNNLKDYFFELSESQERYVYHSPLKGNITLGFNRIYDYLLSVRSNLSKGRYSSLPDFENELISISALISEFNKTLNKNYGSIIIEGKNLSSFEYSKKCYLGYCENTTNDICQDLINIFSEYKDGIYTIPSDIPVLDFPYYVKTDDSVKILASNESEEYYNSYCLNLTGNTSYFKTDIPDIEELKLLNISNISSEDPIRNELTENPPLCCVYGECLPCCTSEECRNNPDLFPVVLIHGHSLLKRTSPESLLDGFNKIQYQLQEDGYINAGTVYFDFNTSDYNQNEWGLSGFPITVKASYYYDYFYSLGGYIYLTKNAENLDTYSIRLNDIINLVKYRTGKPKVNIVAHSMGGLVARRYIQIFGEDSVNKLVLTATPNKGIEGDIKKFCRLFGEKRECEDMYNNSIFIKKLNSPNYEPKEAKFYTISGSGCKTAEKDGDGVVTSESSLISYGKSFVINGTCDDVLKGELLHSELLDIDKYPEAYEYVKEILQ